MLSIFLLTAVVVFLAELGDKTQLVCMAFVARFGVWKVLSAASAAVVVNTGLAVALGEGLSRIVPFSTLQIIAGAGFLGFGLWSLRSEEEEENCPDSNRKKGSPFWTVFFTFFVAELGDKTQLITLGLAAKQGLPVITWLGASAGLIAAQALGIFMSGFIAKHIPPRALQVGAAGIFFIFGTLSLYQNLPKHFISPVVVLAYVLILSFLSYLLLRKKSSTLE
ncbi:MAG: hypothetical protein FD169_1121 [Bacillota bacterium]|nr:MAG: hypothetical protein FD169_1121 [Bacillota bacterium]